MAEYFHLILLFGVGLISGFVNVMAGGGSTLSLPFLIFLGLHSATANGTLRLAILVQNISALSSFRKEEAPEINESMDLAIWTLPGAITGAVAAIKISDIWFQRILAVIIVAIIISMLFNSSSRDLHDIFNRGRKKWLIYPMMLAVGFYGGFIQVGVGFLFMAILYHYLHMNLVRVNMHKVFIVLIYTIPILVIFIWTGNIDWMYGLILGAGAAIGGGIAARISVKRGEKVIRIVLMITMLIMAIKLLELF